MRFQKYSMEQLSALKSETTRTLSDLNREIQLREMHHHGLFVLTSEEVSMLEGGSRLAALKSIRQRMGCTLTEADRILELANNSREWASY